MREDAEWEHNAVLDSRENLTVICWYQAGMKTLTYVIFIEVSAGLLNRQLLACARIKNIA
ncbi:MAG: hypothetical protein OHK0046_17360 [Anaerolineae bacterium]